VAASYERLAELAEQGRKESKVATSATNRSSGTGDTFGGR